MVKKNFDVVIIGGGPGGYVAALRAGQLGMNVACIEKRGKLGGTCLNVGCIPSKALLHVSEKFESLSHLVPEHGIKVDKVSFDLGLMMKHKDKIVDTLTKGIEGLFKKNKVDYIKGEAELLGEGKISVQDSDKQISIYQAAHIIIATGSVPVSLPNIDFDEKRILSSTGALSLKDVPKDLLVIGAGYIGLEMASVWRRLGSNVTVVEYFDGILPSIDRELAKNFQRILEKQGLNFKLKNKITSIEQTAKSLTAILQSADGQTTEKFKTDAILVAVGRKPYTQGLGLEKLGVKLDPKGFIDIDLYYHTNVPGLYAIGDVVKGPMLAHKAEEEGIALVERLAGQAGHVNYDTVPSIIYTFPELASVGKTEEELTAMGISYKVGKFPFSANSRARTNNISEGFVKIIADATTDKLLGAHIIGPEAGTLIHECVMIMEFGGSAEDLARSFHAHPTLNEAVKEAALNVLGHALHI
ncbi:MAG: dihydrolipoyl dehydrogenase [Alphaproteobacteria bacterium]|nr:dihydrolipoyl dehydrogenase [Alphaproteobacteria bacterium]